MFQVVALARYAEPSCCQSHCVLHARPITAAVISPLLPWHLIAYQHLALLAHDTPVASHVMVSPTAAGCCMLAHKRLCDEAVTSCNWARPKFMACACIHVTVHAICCSVTHAGSSTMQQGHVMQGMSTWLRAAKYVTSVHVIAVLLAGAVTGTSGSHTRFHVL